MSDDTSRAKIETFTVAVAEPYRCLGLIATGTDEGEGTLIITKLR